MRRREFIGAVSGVIIAAACVCSAFAQSTGKHPLVGILFPGKIPSPRIDAFLQGLSDNGYNEGQNIRTIIRAAAFDNGRLNSLAKDLIEARVDVLVTSSSPGVVAAQAATRTVPIVFATIADPIALGVAKSLAHPGGNITGITLLSPDINGKRLTLVKEQLPAAKKIAVLENPTNPATAIMARDTQIVARSLGLDARTFASARPEQLNEAMDAVAAWSADAVMPLDDFLFDTNGKLLADSAFKHALPLICGSPDMAALGCLLTYGVDIPANYRQAAALVAKILKGANPADLPIENPTRFQTIVNLKVAKTRGISVPTSILLRADQVIE